MSKHSIIVKETRATKHGLSSYVYKNMHVHSSLESTPASCLNCMRNPQIVVSILNQNAPESPATQDGEWPLGKAPLFPSLLQFQKGELRANSNLALNSSDPVRLWWPRQRRRVGDLPRPLYTPYAISVRLNEKLKSSLACLARGST